MTSKRIMLTILGIIVLGAGGTAAWTVGPALLPAKNINVGIATGAKAPIDMAIRDSAGKATSLHQKMGAKGMVLFLVRSADWCPFCKAQLIRTNDIRSAVAAQGYTLASLSYDKPETLSRFAADKGLGYMMLSDEGSRMIDALGLRDPQYDKASFAYGVPRPTILVLAPDGRVKAKYVSDDYRSRPSNEQVLAMIKGLKG